MKTFFSFFTTKTFLKHFGIMVGVTAIGLFITMSYLDIYTEHGKEFSLPDFRGMTIEQAIEAGKTHDLRFEVMDSVFTRRKKLGSIVEQDPAPGFKVKDGRRIFLILNSSKPEMVRMINVRFVDLKQAWMDIEANGLELDKISFVDDPQMYLVLDQRYNGRSIAKGDAIEKGAGIELVVGKGDAGNTAVPNLLKVNLRNARRKLLNSHLNLGALVYDQSVLTYEDSLRAFVWRHRPFATTQKSVNVGSLVNLWLTVDSTRIEHDSTSLNRKDSQSLMDAEDLKTDSILKALKDVY